MSAACRHESCSFDRSVCACGSMHDYCDECGAAMNCPLDKEPQEQSAATRYRKRPVEVEAVQWDGQNRAEIKAFVGDALDDAWSVGGYCFINTLEGRMNAAPGDWIIRGVQGEVYPVKPDIFEETYEPVA